MTEKEGSGPKVRKEEAEELETVKKGEPDEWERLEPALPSPAAGRRSPVLRKAGISFLVLAAVGVLIFFGRVYLKVPEEPPAARFPIVPPPTATPGAVESNTGPTLRNIPKAEAGPGPPKTPSEGEGKSSTRAPGADSLSSPAPGLHRKDFSSAEAKVHPGLIPGIGKAEADPGLRKTVSVKVGDSIYTIAAKKYRVANTSVVDRILENNPQIPSPGKLLASQQIRLPEITEESLLIKSTDGTYRIRLGTFLKPEYSAFLKGEPALLGREVEITPRKLPSGETWYRATAGDFRTREEGLKAVRELKEKGLSPYFVEFKKR